MNSILKRMKYCPYCGKKFKNECSCPYGKHIKMKMDFDDKLTALYNKKFCPNCSERSSKRVCGYCSHVFDPDDMFY